MPRIFSITIKNPPWTRPLPGLLAALALAGCSQATDSQPPETQDARDLAILAQTQTQTPQARAQTQTQSSTQDCLLVVWQEQAAPDREFDSAHDPAEGGAISCATNTSASQFAAAIEAIRTAARARDRDGILREVNIPLLVIDDTGNRRFAEEAELDASAFEDVFPDDMLDAMAEMDLEDMTVVPERGGYFELGSLWLVATETGGRPRLVTVNRQALAEAAESARRRAEAQQEEETEPSA